MDIDMDISQLSLDDNTSPTVSNLVKLKELIFKDDPIVVLEACTALRKMVSLEQSPPLDDVVGQGFVPRLLELLSSTNISIQCESCWVVTNILSGASKYVDYFIKIGGLIVLSSMMFTNEERLREQVVWAIGNIAGDSPAHRDLVLQANVLPILLENLKMPNSKLTLKRLLIWTVSNLCRGKPKPPLAIVGQSLPAIVSIICTETDTEMIVDALWAMSYLSDANNEDIYEIIKSGVVPTIINMLHSTEIGVLVPALRTFGNLVTGDDKSTLYILSMNPFPGLKNLLSSPKNAIIKETVWSMSNIVACSTKIIQLAINAQMIPPLVHMLATMVRDDLQKELLWCISNLVDGGDPDQVNYLMMDLNAFTVLCNLLDADRRPRGQGLGLILSSLSNVFKFSGPKQSAYITKFVQLNGLENIAAIMNTSGNSEEDIKSCRQIQSICKNTC